MCKYHFNSTKSNKEWNIQFNNKSQNEHVMLDVRRFQVEKNEKPTIEMVGNTLPTNWT